MKSDLFDNHEELLQMVDMSRHRISIRGHQCLKEGSTQFPCSLYSGFARKDC